MADRLSPTSPSVIPAKAGIHRAKYLDPRLRGDDEEGSEGTGQGPRLVPSETTYRYDGTFEGLLALVFTAYARRERPARIEPLAPVTPGRLFGPALVVAADAGQADRVRAGLVRHVGEAGADRLYHAFLSERPGIEEALFALVEAVFARGGAVLDDLRFPPALAAERLAHRVLSEVHRMHAFVRFERRAGDLFVARVRPDFHVLPLLPPHFTARYPAQRWAIADVGRGLALLHEHGAPLRFALADALDALPHADDEGAFQRMWQAYFRAVNIPERANPRLHLRHVPRRYWPYLSEKAA
jgi:probable DNA metabolism protein